MTFNNLIKFKKEYLIDKINVATLELAIDLMAQVGYEYSAKLKRFYSNEDPIYMYEVQKGINKVLLVKRRSFV